MEEFPEPDPLLKPGAYIDPNPPSINLTNCNDNVNVNVNSPSDFHSTTPPPNSTPTNNDAPASHSLGPDPSPGPAPGPETNIWARPDWLPPDWIYVERVRASGASAGSRDKYYVEPVTQRRFRSKTAVLHYLETGIFEKKRKDSETADTTPASNGAAKRKKSETKVKDYMKNFDFDDVPSKVKWELMDIYEGTWRPLSNGVDRVPESTKQEWTAAFTYLSLQNAGRG